jgi:hypothetical protein
MAVIRNGTQHLIDCLMLDVWPRASVLVDFAITTQEQLGALQYALKRGHRTAEEFDAAMGSGAKLTDLCRVPGQPYVVQFEDPWDEEEGSEREDSNDGKDPGTARLD